MSVMVFGRPRLRLDCVWTTVSSGGDADTSLFGVWSLSGLEAVPILTELVSAARCRTSELPGLEPAPSLDAGNPAAAALVSTCMAQLLLLDTTRPVTFERSAVPGRCTSAFRAAVDLLQSKAGWAPPQCLHVTRVPLGPVIFRPTLFDQSWLCNCCLHVPCQGETAFLLLSC